MAENVVIASQFCGPPGSGNGGYSCGLVAEFVDAPSAEVTLHAPPPLERPLIVERAAEGEVRLLDGETLIAVGTPVEESISAGGAVLDARDAVVATEHFDEAGYRADHEFPTCFTCGPNRDPGDGLRIFPAPTDRAEVCGWSWTPHEDFFLSGAFDPKIIWAALDCPSGQAWLQMDPHLGAVVLGRMAASVFRLPQRQETLTVVGCAERAEGRRRMARSAIYGADGELLAAGKATWVTLNEEQRTAFQS